MRWLLLKDLRILRRSPLLVFLLVGYAAGVSLIGGFALKPRASKPKVAFANLVPPTDNSFNLNGKSLDATSYANELFKSIDPIRVKTRAEAIKKVRDGDALAALVVPADVVEKLRSTLSLSGSPQRPTIEVYYNADDPGKRRAVESAINSRLADANQELSRALTTTAASYLDILLKGGEFSLLGQKFSVLGLQRTAAVLQQALNQLPADDALRAPLDQVRRFAQLAIDNLDFSGPVLASISAPVEVKQTSLGDVRGTVESYVAVVAITLSLMLVTLLLGAAMLALEREENAFGRLVRGLVSRLGLIAEKIGLAALCSSITALVMLIVLAAFLDLDFGRAPLWIAALVLGSLAFGAMGVAIGGLTKEVRAASLLVLLFSLPIAGLGLVPTGVTSKTVLDLIHAVSACFPFKPTLDALQSAISGGGSFAGPLAHLAILTVVFTGIARLGLRRFG